MHAPHERGPLHLRRGDGFAQRPGREAGHPKGQAALPRQLTACGGSRPSSTTRRPSRMSPISSGTAPEWYKGLSLSDDGGTKVYAVSGRVKRPGWWELPMGTTDTGASRRARGRHGRWIRSEGRHPRRRLDGVRPAGPFRYAHGLSTSWKNRRAAAWARAP